ncbi:MAG TPA: hypothetical protein VN930_01350 [Xanthobacteraceae bacterium]|nr:hypothetical protein [Xanthobacteraceae bacterium]
MRGLSAGRSFGRASFGGSMRGFRASGFRQFGSARFHGANFRRAHWSGLGRHGTRFAHRGRFIAAAPLLYAPYYFDDFAYAYYDGCYELQPLLTPRGVIWQRTWVCY